MKQKNQQFSKKRMMAATVLLLGMLLPLGMMCSCSNSDETEINDVDIIRQSKRATAEYVQKATPSEEVTAFFSSALHDGQSPTEFFTTLDSRSDTCCLVNSRSELQSLYAGNRPLPEIDFEKNSLVIGKVMLTAGSVISEFEIETKDNSYIASLSVHGLDGTWLAVIIPYYYWGLFEKLPNKEITAKTDLNYVHYE